MEHPDITYWKKGVAYIEHNDGTKMYCPNIINGARHLLQIYYLKNYDPPPIEIEPGDYVVDIGGWIGAFAVYAAKKTGSEGMVYISEPLPHAREFINLNGKANNIKNAIITTNAIGGKEGKADLYYLSLDPEMGYLYENDGHTHFDGKVEIDIITLDGFAKIGNFNRIDFLKMNCEGAEGEIIPTISEKLWATVKKAAIQIHEKLSPIPGKKIIDLFLEHGFTYRDTGPEIDTRWVYFWR